MGSPGSVAKMTGLVAPLANGVSDARPRKALHHVHGAAPKSVRPTGCLPVGFTGAWTVEAQPSPDAYPEDSRSRRKRREPAEWKEGVGGPERKERHPGRSCLLI